MRTIVSGLLGTGVELNIVLQEFEHEVATRLQSCGIDFIWQQNLAYTHYLELYTVQALYFYASGNRQ
jgi:hypothetical protein